MTKVTTSATTGIQLEAEKLLDAAQRATALSDFGDSWFLEPLTALVGFINREAGLPSADVPPVRHMIDMLRDRLRLTDYLKRHPEAVHEHLDVAGILVGQARGGSTLTQRLVGQSPQLTTCYFWELFSPVPLPDEGPGNPVARRKIGDDEVASWSKDMPEYVGMHPLNANYFEDDIWLMDRGFTCTMYSMHFNIPGYNDWLLSRDHTRAYEDLKLWLQVLQHQSPQRRNKKWLLKNNHHLLSCNLPLMFKTFPGAKLIRSHRTMTEAIPSLCSVLSTHIRNSGTTTFDKTEFGPRLVAQYVRGLEHMMAVRREMPADTFIDVRYRDTVAKPIDQFRKVIEGLGLVCGPDDDVAATDWMSKNGRGTHPPHNYKAEDYGLTTRQLADTFQFYHDAFLQ